MAASNIRLGLPSCGSSHVHRSRYALCPPQFNSTLLLMRCSCSTPPPLSFLTLDETKSTFSRPRKA
ncbi:hypothetical protein EV126DRAFT_160707 [Verticillium dahliae]|nr:hypothetical protein EV126DRAFT_160707 [Verticillium dahliae]